MWTGNKHAEVKPGSMIFLPRKQAHCLECLDENGMELMGVFYPAGSPAINYKTGQGQSE
jgi:quercetin dioxygenase-like cupin family protein